MPRVFATPMRRLTLFLAVVVVSFAGAQADGRQIDPNIGVRDAHNLVQSGRVLLVDIRQPAEWRETGIADGAVPLTMHQPLPAFLARLKALSAKHDGRDIALICARGVRTKRMQRVLAANGIKVVNVAPGMLGTWFARGWIQSGLPVRPYGR
jgi:rhodanese-related sulfurtransferase